MKISRRGLIRGFAGLAAVAVAGPALKLLPLDDRARLVRQMRDSGIIQNQKFLINGPIEIRGIKRLTIANCWFIFSGEPPPNGAWITFGGGCEHVLFIQNYIEVPGSGALLCPTGGRA